MAPVTHSRLDKDSSVELELTIICQEEYTHYALDELKKVLELIALQTSHAARDNQPTLKSLVQRITIIPVSRLLDSTKQKKLIEIIQRVRSVADNPANFNPYLSEEVRQLLQDLAHSFPGYIQITTPRLPSEELASPTQNSLSRSRLSSSYSSPLMPLHSPSHFDF